MADTNRKGVIKLLSELLTGFSQLLTASILPPIAQGTELILDTVNKRIRKIERRIIRSIQTQLIITIGLLFLVMSFFFFLVDQLELSKALSYLVIAIKLLFVGLFLKLQE